MGLSAEWQCPLRQLSGMPLRRMIFLVAALVAGWNGTCALVLLLIAPLGLAAVLTLVLLITLSSFAGCLGGIRAIRLLEANGQGQPEVGQGRRRIRGAGD
jgi:hypothetical protein